MVPLHLHTTTIHVTAQDAERLVSVALAEWLPEAPALRLRHTVRHDGEVLAVLGGARLAA